MCIMKTVCMTTKTDAFVPALWESLDKNKKRKFAQILTEPIILPKADDSGWVPEWMLKSLEKERVERALGLKPELSELASDIEASMYLMCGSLDGPISEQACRIYFHSASKLTDALREVMLDESIIPANGQLTATDEGESRRFKKWIRTEQKNSKNEKKIRRFVSVCNNALAETEHLELFAMESQI